MGHKEIHKILFITLSNIGDVVLTLPVLSALKDNFKDADIDVVVGPRPKEIFVKDPRVRRMFVYDKHARIMDKIGFIRKLRKERYDLAVDMRTSLIPFLIGARHRPGFIHSRPLSIPPKEPRALARVGSISVYKDIIKHKKAIHLERLKPLEIGYNAQRNIYIYDKDRRIITRLLEEKGVGHDDILIGISPATRSPLKQWRTEGFIEVAGALLKNNNLKIVLVGDTTQVDTSKEIENTLRHNSLINLTGKINLNKLFALIERMQVLLTCDTASMHIAADLGVRVVAIFGPTDPEEYGPQGKDDVVIRRELECSPCKKAICVFKHECMCEINANEVLKAVESVLAV